MKIIAELGNTHEGSVGLAKCMIKAAANSGANVVKLQTHLFEFESLPDAPNPPYFSDESRKNYFDRTSFNRDQYLELISCAEDNGVDLISSPFSVEAFEFLINIGIKTIKIPSGEVNNALLLNAVALNNINVILSSGMSSIEELDYAVDTLKSGKISSLSLLQCTSEYPCPPEAVGLENINIFKKRYNVEVGFSDHTMSESIPAIAVYAGASIIEKHFTLSRLAYGSDAKNSLEPEEFKRMSRYINEAKLMRASLYEKSNSSEKIQNMKHIFEKSLVYAHALQKGQTLKYSDLAAKKPGNGLPTKFYTELIGKKITRNVLKDEQVKLDDVTC